ncbi:replication initiation protein [Spiroplasma endosymbiont of Polydrusus pterygomalis]|uniref:replication initiation protein n=1 Tax=Spiroplasma endosymbiont of Polydrusus pterygomalis TaxID=3139327 RepID=UPI003CCB5403
MNEWREILCIPKSYDFRHINQKILNPSIKELLPFFPNLKLKKRDIGRKITHIGFIFKN